MTLKEKVRSCTARTAIKGILKILPGIPDERWLSLIQGQPKRKAFAEKHGRKSTWSKNDKEKKRYLLPHK